MRLKLNEEKAYNFTPELMTKTSALSKRNLEAIQDGLNKNDKPALTSLDFEKRG